MAEPDNGFAKAGGLTAKPGLECNIYPIGSPASDRFLSLEEEELLRAGVKLDPLLLTGGSLFRGEANVTSDSIESPVLTGFLFRGKCYIRSNWI